MRRQHERGESQIFWQKKSKCGHEVEQRSYKKNFKNDKLEGKFRISKKKGSDRQGNLGFRPAFFQAKIWKINPYNSTYKCFFFF